MNCDFVAYAEASLGRRMGPKFVDYTCLSRCKRCGFEVGDGMRELSLLSYAHPAAMTRYSKSTNMILLNTLAQKLEAAAHELQQRVHVSCRLNSPGGEGGGGWYIGNYMIYIGDYYRVLRGHTRSADYGSCKPQTPLGVAQAYLQAM